LTILKEFLAAAQGHALPARIASAGAAVGENYARFVALKQAAGQRGEKIYGSDTLPGHLAAQAQVGMEERDVEAMILSSHLLGCEPFFSDAAARHITLAKLYSIAAIGPTVSHETFAAIGEAFGAREFAPRIPRRASYSCGDVIPASHWLDAFLAWQRARGEFNLKTGETMALINGTFVHVGSSTHLLACLEQLWTALLVTYRESAAALDAKRPTFFTQAAPERVWLEDACRFVAQGLPHHRASVQPPVSVRAIPQILETMGRQIQLLAEELEYCLSRPSGNPLVVRDREAGGHAICESGSFVNPALSIASEALLEGFLLTAWGSAQRIQHLTRPARLDAIFGARSQEVQALLVQVPKIAMADLELMRERYPRILFSSGSSTSFGEEDIWTNGVNTNVDAMKCIEDVFKLTALEYYVARLASNPQQFDDLKAHVGPCLHAQCVRDLAEDAQGIGPDLFRSILD
jgi:histidine ammonia-lyase